MVKTRYRQWFAMMLAGLILMAVLFISGGGWIGSIPAASARGTDTKPGGNGCTTTLHSPNFGTSVIVNTNEIACGTLMDFGGKVEINGEMHGKVTVFGSNVVIAGTMVGDIDLYSGVLTLQNGSHMHGDAHLYGSHLIQNPGSQFDGHTINRTQSVDWLIGNGEFSFPTWSILIWVALGLLLIRLLPEHVTFVRATVVHKVKRSFVIGLLSMLLAPAVMIVLVALILPIPVAIIVALGLIAAWTLGTVTIAWLFGEQMVRAIAPQWNTRPVQVVVGLVALALLGSLPYIGWLINLAVGLVGLGAVLLSRFGTRLYSQPKEPISL